MKKRLPRPFLWRWAKSEALLEVKSLSERIDLMLIQGIAWVKTEKLYELHAETRYRPQGVLAVIGPFNFSAHLVNARVIRTLLMGNTMLVKSSELCPWVDELYATCFLEASRQAFITCCQAIDALVNRSEHILLSMAFFSPTVIKLAANETRVDKSTA